MSSFPNYLQYDALGLAELVRTKQVKPIELVEAAIEHIEARNPPLNAVINKLYDQARAIAQGPLPTGPFTGVPFLLKDLLSAYAGAPTSFGNHRLRTKPAPYDSELVRRFKAAGLVVVGKTNTPELGLLPVTEPETFGPTRNPWDLTRTPGGSSGGSAAAVAAGMVPMAGGGDGGGSIRIPASCCGLFGLKPSRGRTPTGPDLGELWGGLVVEHALTRSVRDSAALLDAIAGMDVGAPYAAPPQARPYLQEVGAPVGALRIAFSTQPLMGTAVDPDCVAGVQATVKLLQSLGHQVEEATPPVDRVPFVRAFMTLLAVETWMDIEWIAQECGHAPRLEDVELATYTLGLLGRATPVAVYAQARRYLQMATRPIARFFEQYAVLLTPTLALPPLPIGTLRPTPAERTALTVIGQLKAGWMLQAMGAVNRLAQQTFSFMPYTAVFNITGQPAMSVPLHWNAAGLPIGMQFVGRFGDEATLFRLAGQLEQAQPWAEKRPPQK